METVEDLLTVPADVQQQMDSLFQRALDKVNSVSVSRASQVQRWLLLSRDFSGGGGELGPTLKLRRAIVFKMYQREIEALYQRLSNLLLLSEHCFHSDSSYSYMGRVGHPKKGCPIQLFKNLFAKRSILAKIAFLRDF